MKPYGRIKRIHFPHKTDCHPKKGYENWWEGMDTTVSRTTLKQIFKKHLSNEKNL